MRKRLFARVWLFGLIVGLGGASALQGKEGGPMGPAPKDAYLDRRVGAWEWTGKMYVGGRTIPFTGTEKVEWACNDQFLLSRMTQTPEGGLPPFEYMTVTRAVPGTNEYKQWLFEGLGMTADAKGKREGEAISYEGASEMGKSRTKLEFVGAGEISALTEAVDPGSEEWVPFMEMKGKKSK